MRRDVGTVRGADSPAFVKALDEVVVALMIAKRQCVEELDAVLSVKGIDMVRFGPADYAARRDRRSGTGRNGLAMGVRHFCLGWDVGILHDWWRANGSLTLERPGTEETPE